MVKIDLQAELNEITRKERTPEIQEIDPRLIPTRENVDLVRPGSNTRVARKTNQ